jgi:Reverse transcriptase (RNA-dependent DNA polymerase)/gag-polypeptide of LTR copia-type/Integrase core domain/GAG-pre-integrase domain
MSQSSSTGSTFSSSSPSALYNIEKLNNDNFTAWKYRLSMILMDRGLYEYIDGSATTPPMPATDASVAEKTAYSDYKKKDNAAKAQIGLLVSDTEIIHIEQAETALQAWRKICGVYEAKGLASKVFLRRRLFNMKKLDSDSMQKHVNGVKELVNRLTAIGDVIPDSDVAMTLICSLPAEYDYLTVSLESRPASELTTEFVINRLLAEERRREESTKDKVADGKVAAFFSNNHQANYSADSDRSQSDRPTCSYCKKIGHVEKNCYGKNGYPAYYRRRPINNNNNYKANKATVGNAFISAINGKCENPFTVLSMKDSGSDTNTICEWFIDSGASVHYCNEQQWFSSYSSFPAKDISLGDNHTVKAIGVGDIPISIQLNNDWIIANLKDVYYVPNMAANLLSVSKMTAAGLQLSFNNNECTIINPNGDVIGRAKREADNSLYRLTIRYEVKDGTAIKPLPESARLARDDITTVNNDTMSDVTKSSESDSVGTKQFKMWHERLGHLSLDAMNTLQNNSMVIGADYSTQNINHQVSTCEGCIKGKTHRTAILKISGYRATHPLELVHSDVCGPMQNTSFGGSKYFITFIDDYTRYMVVKTMKSKDEAMNHFLDYKAYAENLTGHRIKILRSDNGGEYCSKSFDTLLRTLGISRQKTPPYTPELNGVAERANRTLVESARSMLHGANLDFAYWGEALLTSVYLRNRSPTRSLANVTPYEAWYGKKPTLNHLRIFGCKAYAHVPKVNRGKLDAKAIECVFVGYSNDSDTYRLYDQTNQCVFVSRDVKFIEDVLGQSIGGRLPSESSSSNTSSVLTSSNISSVPTSISDSSISNVLSTPSRQLFSNVPNIEEEVVADLDNDDNYDNNIIHNDIPLAAASEEKRSEPVRHHVRNPRPYIAPQRVSARDHASTRSLNAGLRNAQPEAKDNGAADPHQHIAPQYLPQQSSFSEFAGGLQRFYPPSSGSALIASNNNNSHELLEPVSYNDAMNRSDSEQWEQAAKDEYDSIQAANTWTLVPLPAGRDAIGSKWVFKIKRNADGSVERYKARLVAKGYSQQEGIDYNDTFAPVVKFSSIRTLLALGAYYDWEIHQLDVKTAFLNGDLEEDIYMKQPEGFTIRGKETLVCKLNKSLYGLKQSGRAWYKKMDTVLLNMKFTRLKSDHCVYFRSVDNVVFYVAIYVDDILLLSNSLMKINSLKKELSQLFDMKDLGEAHFVLGIRIERNRAARTLTLSQSEYVKNVISRFGMSSSHPVSTPLDVSVKLSKADCPATQAEINNMKDVPYQSALGAIMYAMIATRPDIAFAVTALSQFSNNPGLQHWVALKRVLRYLNGTTDYKLMYGNNRNDENSVSLLGYCDADWGSNVDDRRSVTGYIFLLNGGAVTWQSKKQPTVALSSVEAEYMAANQATKEAIWLRTFIAELNINIPSPTSIACDSQGAMALTKNPEYHSRTKHIDIQHHYVREKVDDKSIEFKFTSTTDMMADALTKPIVKAQHEKLIKMIGLQSCLSGSVGSHP